MPSVCSIDHPGDTPQPPAAPSPSAPWLLGPRQADSREEGQGKMPGMKGSQSLILVALGTEMLVAKVSHSLRGLFGSSGVLPPLGDVVQAERCRELEQGEGFSIRLQGSVHT